MSDVLMSFVSLVSPGDDGDPRPKRSQLARVARCTGLSERYGSQIPRADDTCDVAAAATEAGALMARVLLGYFALGIWSQIPRADDACDVAAGTEAGTLMVRTLLVMSCVARLDDEDIGAGGIVEKAWRRAGGQCPVPMQSTR
uniref:Uncharacterized protein n=1 Tax=Oryza rufipogon TaxID=4529 RepID=A0A0E0P606_ORYRU